MAASILAAIAGNPLVCRDLPAAIVMTQNPA
jgi:hypothetical protein